MTEQATSAPVATTLPPPRRIKRINRRMPVDLHETPLPSTLPHRLGESPADKVVAEIRAAFDRADLGYRDKWMGARGAGWVLDLLGSVPGRTWQERWDAGPLSPFDRDRGVEAVAAHVGEDVRPLVRHTILRGFQALIAVDAIRPDIRALAAGDSTWLNQHIHRLRGDPHAGLAEEFLDITGLPKGTAYQRKSWLRSRLTQLVILTGQPIAGLTIDDLVVFGRVFRSTGRYVTGLDLLGAFLVRNGFTEGDYRSRTKRHGQRSPSELIEAYDVRNADVAALLVAYLERRATSLDWNTTAQLARVLTQNFWCVIEDLDPAAQSLALTPSLAATWKTWLRYRRDDDGNVIGERGSYFDELNTVRRFYLDLQEWAHDEPERWGPWAARSPVGEMETRGGIVKRRRHIRSEMHERIRERVPNVDTLLSVAAERYAHMRDLLSAATSAGYGTTFQVGGQTYTRIDKKHREHARVTRQGEENGPPIDTIIAEEDAFWAYTAAVLLRHTGVRIEELLEMSQFALRDYVHPDPNIGRVPLLHIAPSKTDKERIIVLEPEAVACLGAIMQRVRKKTGCGRTLPLVVGYDYGQRQDLPALPLFFQRTAGRGFKDGRTRPMSRTYVADRLTDICEAAGLTVDGETLRFTPHDFRRIFATEKQNSGDMQPHIVQALLGHESLTTTQGYVAVFNADVVAAHARWIEMRRQARPDDYRQPTDHEWADFTENFMTRKIAIGDCMRQYNSACDHEYACERCELARVDQAGIERLRVTRSSVIDQIAEAEAQGWKTEREGKQTTLAAIDRKIESYERSNERSRLVALPLPTVRVARVPVRRQQSDPWVPSTTHRK